MSSISSSSISAAMQRARPETRENSRTPEVASDSPPRPNMQSTTKSWCSSPFSNLIALSPDTNSLSFSLTEFSPGTTFSSPRMRFQPDHPSPQSSNRAAKDNFSLFSPSLFSPFNKSLKPHKMDKLLEPDFLDNDPTMPMSSSKGYASQLDQQDHLFSFGMPSPADARYTLKQTHLPKHKRVHLDISEGVQETMFDDAVLLGDEISSRFEPSPERSPYKSSASPSGDSNHSAMSSAEKISGLNIMSAGELSLSSPLSSQQQIKLRFEQGMDELPPSSSYAPLSLPLMKSTPLPPKPQEGAISAKKLLLSTAKMLPFSSPALLSKPKQPTTLSPNMDIKGHCNCKKSKCLKLYCECFAALRYCSSCHCVECQNCKEFDQVRQDAIQLTKERNPTAFQLKVSVKKGHMAGCNCKKSRCLKKYCECFEGSVFCGPNCKCVDCQNHTGSEALQLAKSSIRDKRLSLSLSGVKTESVDEGESCVVSPPPSVPPLLSSPPLSGEGAAKDAYWTVPSRYRLDGSDPDKAYDLSRSQSLRGSSADPLDRARHLPVADNLPTPSPSDRGRGGSSCDSDTSGHVGSPNSDTSSQRRCDSVAMSGGAPPLKKRRVEFARHDTEELVQAEEECAEPRYRFFGPKLPGTTKLIALSCLEYLDGPTLYSMSVVSRLWCQAAMDEALWE